MNCSNDKCLETRFLCTSFCVDLKNCNRVIQCDDKSLILLSQYCDRHVDCVDGSDEIVNLPGFKCDGCVLPQANLFDDFPHCSNGLDLCLNNSCFQCLDKRLIISNTQVCDDINDCYDFSDECLCYQNLESNMCKNSNMTKDLDHKNKVETFSSLKYDLFHQQKLTSLEVVECDTKYLSQKAVRCDGRPECKDYSDECSCKNPPAYCNDNCRCYFFMGDRYCDGVEDPAWQLINHPDCPKGFDERDCPKRFKCNASGRVSIDVRQQCNGVSDCDDGSDEQDCPSFSPFTSIFSSDTEMIASPVIRAAFWITGSLIVIGNTYVVITNLLVLKGKTTVDNVAFQHVILLNISIADFIMGIYLLVIVAVGVGYSGVYGSVDQQWRSSLNCSIVGSLAFWSSESSCFLMVVLTAFRYVNIKDPLKAKTSSLFPWKVCLVFAWLLSFVLCIAPMLTATSDYFVHTVSFPSRFQREETWDVAKLRQFVHKYSSLGNLLVDDYSLDSLEVFLENTILDETRVKRFGYYGQTSVCMPRFFVKLGTNAWEYTVFLITLNFACFCFIAVSYLAILKLSTKSSANLRNSKSSDQSNTLQNRIARIVATNFCCWIPICIMTYVRLGVEFSDIAYQVSAVLLLPINSALNPILFSSLLDKMSNMLIIIRRKLSG